MAITFIITYNNTAVITWLFFIYSKAFFYINIGEGAKGVVNTLVNHSINMREGDIFMYTMDTKNQHFEVFLLLTV